MRKAIAPGLVGLTNQLRHQLSTSPFTTGWIQWGKVHAVHSAPHTVDLYLTAVTKGSGFTATKTLTPKVRYLKSYTPTVGDVVLVLRTQGSGKTDRIVLGVLA